MVLLLAWLREHLWRIFSNDDRVLSILRLVGGHKLSFLVGRGSAKKDLPNTNFFVILLKVFLYP